MPRTYGEISNDLWKLEHDAWINYMNKTPIGDIMTPKEIQRHEELVRELVLNLMDSEKKQSKGA